MDSGREALLEKAREFGSLSKNWSIDEFLERTVTYRTLALYLGIQDEWWDEFWRSFSFSKTKNRQELKLSSFRFCCNAKDLRFIMMFLSCWFGENMRITDIPHSEFEHAYHLVVQD